MKLTPEQQEIRAANQAKNLQNQVNAIFNRTNEGSFETVRRYKATGKRFCDFLGKTTNLQSFRNVQVRHVKAYVEYLQDLGLSPSYIITEVSGIKWIHERANPKRNLPQSNRCFELDKRDPYKWDMSIKDIEFKEGVKTAKATDRMDAVLEFYMGRYFGLRHEEFVTLRVYHIEHAIKYDQLHIKNTKGGRERDIPVDTDMQKKILRHLLAYAKDHGKLSNDYLICDNYKASVKREMKSLGNWMNNHKHKFADPNRTNEVRPGKKPRHKSIHWHSLRHSYYQETKVRLKAEGKLTDEQIEDYLSEALGHSRWDVNNEYSNDIKRIKRN